MPTSPRGGQRHPGPAGPPPSLTSPGILQLTPASGFRRNDGRDAGVTGGVAVAIRLELTCCPWELGYVGSPSFRRKPETTPPPTPRDSASTPDDGQPLRRRRPRLSPGRRSRVGPPPVIPTKAGIHVLQLPGTAGQLQPTSNPHPSRHSATPPSFRRKPEPTYPNSQGQQVNSSRMATATPPVTPASLPSFRRKPEST